MKRVTTVSHDGPAGGRSPHHPGSRAIIELAQTAADHVHRAHSRRRLQRRHRTPWERRSANSQTDHHRRQPSRLRARCHGLRLQRRRPMATRSSSYSDSISLCSPCCAQDRDAWNVERELRARDHVRHQPIGRDHHGLALQVDQDTLVAAARAKRFHRLRNVRGGDSIQHWRGTARRDGEIDLLHPYRGGGRAINVSWAAGCPWPSTGMAAVLPHVMSGRAHLHQRSVTKVRSRPFQVPTLDKSVAPGLRRAPVGGADGSRQDASRSSPVDRRSWQGARNARDEGAVRQLGFDVSGMSGAEFKYLPRRSPERWSECHHDRKLRSSTEGAAPTQKSVAAAAPDIDLTRPGRQLGWGELGCYGGGAVRGSADAAHRCPRFRRMRFLSFNVESDCVPTRFQPLMTNPASHTHRAAAVDSGRGPQIHHVGSDAGPHGARHGDLPGSGTGGPRRAVPALAAVTDEWYGISRTTNESLFTSAVGFDPAVVDIPCTSSGPARRTRPARGPTRRRDAPARQDLTAMACDFIATHGKAGRFFLPFPSQLHFPTCQPLTARPNRRRTSPTPMAGNTILRGQVLRHYATQAGGTAANYPGHLCQRQRPGVSPPTARDRGAVDGDYHTTMEGCRRH